MFNVLKSLTFEELQNVEAFSQNDYLKNSTRLIMNVYQEDLGPIKKLDY